MCGLVCIYSYRHNQVQVDQRELLRIRDTMISRGPDDAGLWISDDSKIGLGHRRLSIIDLSPTGHQPMSSKDGRYFVVFNGEIYNYQKIRKDLEQKKYRFQSQSDTEVLLYLYQEYGKNMLLHLQGMFSFVIWDTKEKNLFAARDHFGIKPLYYSDHNGVLRIASQVKALLTSDEIPKDPQPAGYVGFFMQGSVPEPYTLYKHIFSLPAGNYLLVKDGKAIIEPYFSIVDEIVKAQDSCDRFTPEMEKERLYEALLNSVKNHLIADVPVGVFLSAGIDSSSLLALVKQLENNHPQTITLGFKEYENTPYDEVILAKEIAHCMGAQHTACFIAKDDFLVEKERILTAMDQPTIDGVNTYFVAKIAAEQGLKVALSGLGGDELFGGYLTFSQIPKMVHGLSWAKSFPFLGHFFRLLSAPLLSRQHLAKYASLLEMGGSYGGAYLLRRGLYMPWELEQFFHKAFIAQGIEELQFVSKIDQDISSLPSSHLKVMAMEMQYYMRNQLLRDADWAGMAHSLEIRVPFVDIELFRFVIKNSVFNCSTKYSVASLFDNVLPKDILHRKKSGFNTPVNKWCSEKTSQNNRVSDGLRDWAIEVYTRFV